MTVKQQKRVFLFMALLLTLFIRTSGAYADPPPIAVSVSPASLPSDSTDHFTIQTNAYEVGGPVMFEVFYDTNGNGSIDAGEWPFTKKIIIDNSPVASSGGGPLSGIETDPADKNITAAFSFNGGIFAPGKYIVRVTDSHSQTDKASFTVTSVTVTSRTVRGHVYVQEKNGALTTTPVTNVFVYSSPTETEGLISLAVSDTQGSYTFQIPDAQVGVNIEIGAFKNGYMDNSAVFSVPNEGLIDTFIYLKVSDAQITGTVMDVSTGSPTPIWGVNVWADDGNYRTDAVWDINGTYSIPVLAGAQNMVGADMPDGYFGLSIPPDYYSRYKNITPAADGPNEVNFTAYKETAWITGPVLTEDGQPVEGALLYVYRINTDDPVLQYLRSQNYSDADGNVSVGLNAGDWTAGLCMYCWDKLITVGGKEMAPLWVTQDILTLQSGDQIATTLKAYYADGAIEGTVYLNDGTTPVSSGLAIWAETDDAKNMPSQTGVGPILAYTTTDDNGHFRLPLLGGTWSITTDYYQGFQAASQTVTLTTNGDHVITASETIDLNLVLDQPMNVSLSGTIVDKDGAPISGARIEMVEDTSIYTISADDGAFTVDGLPAGQNFSLKVSIDTYIPMYTAILKLTQNVANVTYTMYLLPKLIDWGIDSGKGVITGTVVNQFGSGMGGAVVTCNTDPQHACPDTFAIKYYDGTNFVDGTSTYDNGKFHINNVPDGGVVSVSVSKPGWNFTTKTFNTHADSRSASNFVGTYSGSVSGKITYSGSRAGALYVALFKDPVLTPTSQALNLVQIRAASNPNTYNYTLSNVADGTYYVGAIITGGEGFKMDDPHGMYGSSSLGGTPQSLTIANGNVLTGTDFTLFDGTAEHPNPFYNGKFAVISSVVEHGSIACNPATVSYGSTSTCTAFPADGYHVAGVTGCKGSLSGSTYITGAVTAQCAVTASFEINTYSIKTAADSNGGITCSPATVNHGLTSTCTATPNANCNIASVTGCGGSLSGSTYTTGAVKADCTVTAAFVLGAHTVTVSTGEYGGITCSPTTVINGSTSTCTATPDTGYNIASVTGCEGTLSGGKYTTGAITADCSVKATFALQSFTVTASAGSGGSITCSPTTANYGLTSTCTATPATGYVATVTGCEGTLSGGVYTTGAIAADCAVKAAFALQTFTVTASAGSGGSISPSGALTVNYGGDQAFEITPDSGYHIADLKADGKSVGGLAEYTLYNIAAAHTIEAVFAADSSVRQFKLTVKSSGKGRGTISSSDEIIKCASDKNSTCTATYYEGGVVILTATPDSGSEFSKWMNCPAADGDSCPVTMSSSKAVLAVFAVPLPAQYTLMVTTGGKGNGSVTADEADCSAGCAYTAGATATLTATASDDGSAFAGWSGGGCSGTDPCTVTMSGDLTIKAAFTQPAPAGKHNLTVVMDGLGAGIVKSSLNGLTCADNVCTAVYDGKKPVVLTAIPDKNSLLGGWEFCDNDKNGKCTINKMVDDMIVTATFMHFPKLFVTVNTEESESGIGTGTVMAVMPDKNSKSNINCGNSEGATATDCDQAYNKKTQVTLKAVADAGSEFSSWEGCDTAKGNICAVTIDTEDQEVIATFTATSRYTVTVATDGNGSGKVTGTQKGIDSTGITCIVGDQTSDCSSDFGRGVTVTLVAAVDTGSKFMGWSGYACQGKTSPTTCKISSSSINVYITASFGKPEMAVSVDQLDFGSAAKKDAISKTFEVSNAGAIGLALSFNITGKDAKMFKVYSSGKAVSKATVAAGATGTEFEVRFKPASKGLKKGVLTITSNDPNKPKVYIQLDGTGQ